MDKATELFNESLLWAIAAFAANMIVCSLLASEVARFCLRSGFRWRYFAFVPFVLAFTCAPTAVMIYLRVQSSGEAKSPVFIFVSILCSLFLVSEVLWVNPRQARANADKCDSWDSLLDGDAFGKKYYAIRLAALHRMDNLLIVVTGTQSMMIVGLRATEYFPGLDGQVSEYEKVPASWLVIAVAPMAIIWGVTRFLASLHRHRKLISVCLSKAVFDISVTSSSSQDFEISRWRNPEHKDLFCVARCIEKCLPQLKNRYTVMQYEEISKTYSALALELRNEATKTHKKSERVDILLLAATTISLNDDLMETCRRLRMDLAVAPDRAEHVGSSRVGELLSSVDGVLARNSRVLVAFGLTIAIVYYLATGQFEKIMDLIRAG